ncbi:HNH endonuclease [Haloarcula sp. R1-2]|nr:HNH endonuclease [Haloarcula sp. R1-2]
MKMSLGKSISPDVEDIIPDESFHNKSGVDENSTDLPTDSQGDKNDGESETTSPESEGDVSDSGESQTSTESSGSEYESDLTELREQANEAAVEEVPESATTSTQTKQQYSRASEVRDYVMARADGECEGCEEPAPFTSKTGEPYLHAHHVHELSDGGSDTPDTVIALCPNCHYRVHHGEDGEEYNQELLDTVQEIETN